MTEGSVSAAPVVLKMSAATAELSRSSAVVV